MTAVHGKSIDIPTFDGVADAYIARPDDGSPHPGVLLYTDAFGLRPFARAMADRLASNGYTVLVPNVFYRSGRAPVAASFDGFKPEGRDGTSPRSSCRRPRNCPRSAPCATRARI